jgi:hypothetical protein
VKNCGETYVLSDQGFAIEEKAYKQLKGHNRRKRDDRDAARLTASSVHNYKSLRAAVKSISRTVCQQLQFTQLGDPISVTLALRALMGNPYLQADLAVAGIAEAWPCIPVVGNITFPPSTVCYKHPRATVPGLNSTRYFNTKVGILISSSSEGSCEIHRYQVLELNSRLWRLDQLTGELTDITDEVKEPPSAVIESPLTGLAPLIFQELAMLNQTDPSEKWEAYLRAARARDQARMGQEWKNPDHPNSGHEHYPTPFTWSAFLGLFVPSDAVVKVVALMVMIYFAVKLFWIGLWPCIATRLLKKAHLADSGEVRRLKKETKELKEMIEALMNGLDKDDTNKEQPKLERATKTRVTFRIKKDLEEKGLLSLPETSSS